MNTELGAIAPQLPMTNIHNLGMTDTGYAQLAAQGYDPNKRKPAC
ncbi:MAG: hypothetical protein ACR2LR_09535 [Hassallia sp.]